MKKIQVLAVALFTALLLSQPVLASECPSLMKRVDQKLETAELSEEERQEVASLRREGETLHRNGDHDGAVEALLDALSLLGE